MTYLVNARLIDNDYRKDIYKAEAMTIDDVVNLIKIFKNKSKHISF